MGNLKLSEDWWAVVLGMVLIAVVYLGAVKSVPW